LVDDAHAARRRYKKDLDLIKPDMEAYNKQKAIAMGYAPGALVGFNPSAATSASALQVRATSSHSSFLSQVLTLL
jgi:pre-mRNA-splicing factor SYF2